MRNNEKFFFFLICERRDVVHPEVCLLGTGPVVVFLMVSGVQHALFRRYLLQAQVVHDHGQRGRPRQRAVQLRAFGDVPQPLMYVGEPQPLLRVALPASVHHHAYDRRTVQRYVQQHPVVYQLQHL